MRGRFGSLWWIGPLFWMEILSRCEASGLGSMALMLPKSVRRASLMGSIGPAALQLKPRWTDVFPAMSLNATRLALTATVALWRSAT